MGDLDKLGIEKRMLLPFGGNARRITRRVEDREDNNLGSIKMKIPSFHCKNNPESYLE